MSDEKQQKPKKSRRAARRGQQQGDASTTPSAEQAEPKVQPKAKKQSARQAGTSGIRDEGLRAREAAAARRRKKRDRERAQAAAEGLDTSELVDDALARGAHATTRFLQRNFKWMQWVVIVGVVGGFGLLIYNYRVELGNQKATSQLMNGLNAETGRVADEQDLGSEVSGFVDTRPEFESTEARLKAAAEGYQKAIDGDPSEARRTLAKMGLAGVRFDQGKYKEAEAGYREVKESALAAKDESLKGRATEGVGLSLAALDKSDDATKVFKELENLGGNFARLGQYHRARLLYAKGNKDKAKELLQKVLKKSDEKEQEAFAAPGFVELAAQQLLEAIDPGAAKPQGNTISPEQLKKIQEQLQKAAGLKGPDDPKMEDLMKAINSSMGEEGETPTEPSPEPDPPAPAPKAPAPAPAAPAPKAPAPAPEQKAPAPKAPAPAPAQKAPAPAPAPAPAAPAAPETP